MTSFAYIFPCSFTLLPFLPTLKKLASQKQAIFFDENFIATPHQVS